MIENFEDPCPVCGSIDTPKYDAKSNWCRPCTYGELTHQKAEDVTVMFPQVIHG